MQCKEIEGSDDQYVRPMSVFLLNKCNLPVTGLSRRAGRINTMNLALQPERLLVGSLATYAVRLAATPNEVRAAQALRFEVFNLELNEGLQKSYRNRLDRDVFDGVCDHLLVEHLSSGNVVGTYRLQTGANAAAK